MKRTKDLPVGAILVRKNGKRYEIVKAPNRCKDVCRVCAFDNKTADWCTPMPCVFHEREDRTDIIYIRRKDLEQKSEDTSENF